ncbi:MAG: GNAT family N-acetyltransferase [Acidiferrobacterales bacterium]|nr:GNAT family N-acetyltransferase [Acidiferrobacterales bacterium]
MSDTPLEQPFPRPLSGKLVESPPPALVPSRSEIVGKYVVLEAQDPCRHASALYQCSHNTEDGLKIWNYLTYGPWPSETAYFQFLKNQSASLDPIFYSIRDKHSDAVCGQASYLDIHPVNGVIEIGHIWFGPSLQKTTAATEALYLMIKHAMEDLGYRRMQWRCNSLNQSSRNAAKRLGFRFEGIFYNHLIFKGKNRDTAWYSILDDEWPELNSIFERWLEPSNFDADGKARQSLSGLMQHRSPSMRDA